ncbi:MULTISPECIES: hypothetical protein [unclassified Massilia]|uniref:hypothetical protein n=1 Tax=unclassified Massilia TaxID=2609279 RepID=UPI00178765D0|nr:MULTISPECIES: hypothetical protein [unclassified Massilia]MBD8531538.1 hypothetical protein [Massilia sp. CFBP 13647]MBD8673666.1 hypothetical protein [Massilia sp. CFBP 13721]
MTPADNKERKRAQAAAQVKEFVEMANENWPMRCELIRYRAREVHQQFVELQKAGFTDAQAIELCWRQL